MHERSERNTQTPAPEARVSALLSAAAAPTEHGPVPGEEAAMAAFRAARQTASRRSRMFRHPRSLKIAAAAAMGSGVLVAGALAPVASGTLPGAAQETARDMLSKFGVTVPGPDEHSSGHSEERGKSAEAEETAGSERSASGDAADNQGKGDEVSELARNTDASGADKGAEISGFASEGRSHAGENGGDRTSGPPESAGSSAGHAQVDTPNSGGADRPEQTSEGTGGNGGSSDGHAQVDTPNSGGADRPEPASGGGDGRGDDEQEQTDAGASGQGAVDKAGDGRRADGSQSRP
jgi:hypothetical protein